MINTVTFIWHHDGHTHNRPTKVPTSADYLLEQGVTFHFKELPELPSATAMPVTYLWTENDDGYLAGIEVDPSEVSFPTAWEVLTNATLDVLLADG